MSRRPRLGASLFAALGLLTGGPAAAEEASRFEAIGPWRLVCDRLGQMDRGSRTETCRASARKGLVALWVVRDPWSIWIDVEVSRCAGVFSLGIPLQTLSTEAEERTRQVAAQFTRIVRTARTRCTDVPDVEPVLRSADFGRMLARGEGLRSLNPEPTPRR